MVEDTPEFIRGDLSVDDRGSVSFVNSFDFHDVVRFYRVHNHSTDVVRAWHGHKKESKYVYVVSGSAIVAAVPFDDKKNPATDAPVHRYVLSAAKPAVLRLPAGYANGFRPLEEDTVILFFSTCTLDESKDDDYRFPYDYWGRNVWEVENR